MEDENAIQEKQTKKVYADPVKCDTVKLQRNSMIPLQWPVTRVWLSTKTRK